jgi:poly-gamma-glutamate synthesis protein (capsule biosynthesis protein)
MPAVTLFLCGDVMTGRGIDQILAEPCAPHLYEPVAKDAREYVEMAERTGGPIPRRVTPSYPWGVALAELERRCPAARIVNLETSVTTSEDADPKGINYRMHPANVAVLSSARIDCAVLANNHVLDWGRAGLLETLGTLRQAGIRVAGAGQTIGDAQAPAGIGIAGNGRVFVLGVSGPDCGVPRSWRATATEPGVFRIDDYSPASVDRIGLIVTSLKRPGDIAVVSIHWGGNWGYEVPNSHRQFAHGLIERAAVDVVHGHSSHHAKGIEVYHERPIVYGCGDFLNDYEGIHGPEDFRDDLTFMYFATLDEKSGELRRLEMVPLRIHNFRLQRPSPDDRAWLWNTMARECGRFSHHVVARDDVVTLEWT